MRTPELIRQLLTDRAALICTLYGETAGEPVQSQIAAGCVIRNRVHADLNHDGKANNWWGSSFKDVCLAKWQFSCWWELGTPNSTRVYALADAMLDRQPLAVGPAVVAQLGWIADGLIGDAVIDLTNGANHYCTMQMLRSAPPKWSVGKSMICSVGAHGFFRL